MNPILDEIDQKALQSSSLILEGNFLKILADFLRKNWKIPRKIKHFFKFCSARRSAGVQRKGGESIKLTLGVTEDIQYGLTRPAILKEDAADCDASRSQRRGFSYKLKSAGGKFSRD